ncbi:hypothetical protein GCM10010983_26390 [Caulobacter rhizosphaerae]|nr:hypothetical protein GCM10010983_26390 [Caulobacter rhizosphaerae]
MASGGPPSKSARAAPTAFKLWIMPPSKRLAMNSNRAQEGPWSLAADAADRAFLPLAAKREGSGPAGQAFARDPGRSPPPVNPPPHPYRRVDRR